MIQAAIQATGSLSWLAENWVTLLAIGFVIAFLYLFSALMLDLPLPFENREKEGRARE